MYVCMYVATYSDLKKILSFALVLVAIKYAS